MIEGINHLKEIYTDRVNQLFEGNPYRSRGINYLKEVHTDRGNQPFEGNLCRSRESTI